jgi:hypothetical protein
MLNRKLAQQMNRNCCSRIARKLSVEHICIIINLTEVASLKGQLLLMEPGYTAAPQKARECHYKE